MPTCAFPPRAVKFYLHPTIQRATVPLSRPKRKKSLKRSKKLSQNSSTLSARRQVSSSPHAPKKSSKNRIGQLFENLVSVQSRLRAPGGCPWDREQTHATLRTYLIEESYEVLDAIEKENPSEMAEELGDLLLQVLFHADLARETGAFDISHVITGIRDKMIRRHPHVFGNVKADTSDEVLINWAKLKAKEKESASAKAGASSSGKPAPSALDGVPRSLPGLLEAYQLSRRAAQVGFDWPHVEGVLEKLEEEIAEVRKALSGKVGKSPGEKRGEEKLGEQLEEELGDLLFTVVNLARFLKYDPEVVLKKSNLKFKKRFQKIETKASARAKKLSDLSPEALDELWRAAKAEERSPLPRVPR